MSEVTHAFDERLHRFKGFMVDERDDKYVIYVSREDLCGQPYYGWIGECEKMQGMSWSSFVDAVLKELKK